MWCCCAVEGTGGRPDDNARQRRQAPPGFLQHRHLQSQPGELNALIETPVPTTAPSYGGYVGRRCSTYAHGDVLARPFWYLAYQSVGCANNAFARVIDVCDNLHGIRYRLVKNVSVASVDLCCLHVMSRVVMSCHVMSCQRRTGTRSCRKRSTRCCWLGTALRPSVLPTQPSRAARPSMRRW